VNGGGGASEWRKFLMERKEEFVWIWGNGRMKWWKMVSENKRVNMCVNSALNSCIERETERFIFHVAKSSIQSISGPRFDNAPKTI